MAETCRYKLTLAYDGSQFHGWQKQEPPDRPILRTVQGVVEEALVRLLRQPKEVINLTGASRTDAGVHALGQIAHFDAQTTIPLERFALALNSRLPKDVDALRCERTHPTFDAITDARCKQYRYRLWVAPRRPLDRRGVVYPVLKPVDIDAMRDAATRLMGRHDLEGFSAAGHGRAETIRNVFHAAVDPVGEDELHFVVQGDGFLWNSVRIMAGTLVEVGVGRRTPDIIDKVYASGDRQQAGPTLPPVGLWLEWIEHHDPAVTQLLEQAT